MLATSKDKIKSVRRVVRAGVELLAHEIESGQPEVLSECLRAMARFPSGRGEFRHASGRKLGTRKISATRSGNR